MYRIATEIGIDAGPDAIWAVLTDFGRYAEWNPFIVRGQGVAEPGETLELDIHPPGGKPGTHRPAVLTAEPARRLIWLGKAPAGLFTTRHEFVLGIEGAGTRLYHREAFTGLLVPFLKTTLKRTEAGFAAMNDALKQRVEA